MQVTAEDSVVTITDDTPTVTDQVCVCIVSVCSECVFVQDPKCFCAKSTACPTIGESSDGVGSDNSKVSR